jgi:hypothetical protein
MSALQLTAEDDLSRRIDAVDLKHRLGNVETDCCDRLHACLPITATTPAAVTSTALTRRWGEPSTASNADIGGDFDGSYVGTSLERQARCPRPPVRRNFAPSRSKCRGSRRLKTSIGQSIERRALWASSVRACTMTADYRLALLVPIKTVRPATNAPDRKAVAAMTEASFQCSRGGRTALATRLNWRSLATSAANASFVSFASKSIAAS